MLATVNMRHDKDTRTSEEKQLILNPKAHRFYATNIPHYEP